MNQFKLKRIQEYKLPLNRCDAKRLTNELNVSMEEAKKKLNKVRSLERLKAMVENF